MPPSAAEHEVRRGKIAPLDYFHWKLQKKHPYPPEGVDEDGLVKQRESGKFEERSAVMRWIAGM